jgi:hypothetical protein
MLFIQSTVFSPISISSYSTTKKCSSTSVSVFIVLSTGITAMENKTESNREIEQEQTGNYLGINFIRAPKTNHDAMKQIGQPFVEWFKKQGVRPEIYYLSGTSTIEQNEAAPEGLESITNKLSVGQDEELWVLLQFYRDQSHANDVYSKMMQDESIGHLVKKFDGLITQGSSLIMAGFSHAGV